MPLDRPAACRGCVLDDKATGYAPADGPASAWLLLLAEALGATEAVHGRPMMGDAGAMLQRLLNLLGWDRASLRIENRVRCRPPGDWFDERAPWYHGALAHCKYYESSFADGPKVVVPMGGVALRATMKLEGHKKIRVQDWHGTVQRDPTDRFWVVPTYHPSFLQRGAHNLIGTVLWDLQRAEQVYREGGWAKDPATVIVDPPVMWFSAWVDQVLEAVRQDPLAYPVSQDVETPDKAHGRDEGEITNEDRSYQLLRINVSCHPDEGISVPASGPFLDEIQRLNRGVCEAGGVLWFWNKEYDVPRLITHGLLREEWQRNAVDLMWLWHFLQSDLPRGLGFAAPFYSSFGPWKHLADLDPGRYAAIDGFQTHRVGFGVTSDLMRTGQYAMAMRHTHQLHHLALRPAQLVGVRIDRPYLTVYKADLTEKARVRLQRLQEHYPEALAPLTPAQGLTAPPLDHYRHVKASNLTRKGAVRKGKPIPEIKQELYASSIVIEKLVIREVWACTACGAGEVHRKHRCQNKSLTPNLELVPATVRRWFWQEPFNPDSWQQVLSYIKWKKHKPGKAKKTRKDSTNRETLERLERTGDPFYRILLDYRAINKVKGTYAEGTERRLDDEDRVHPTPTFAPSTMRLSYVDPNITNVIADKGGKESLAAGFRRCIIAGTVRPQWLTDAQLEGWLARWGVDSLHAYNLGKSLFDCELHEADFAGVEAIQTGWDARDSLYLRLAKLGVHAALASHVLGRPYDPAWSDEELGAYFKAIKGSEPEVYDRSKRFIHGKSYGLTIQGMVLQFPQLFPTRAVAEQYDRIHRQMAPGISAWQRKIQLLAAKQHFLGGAADHPYAYSHRFWSIFTYRKIPVALYYKILSDYRMKGMEEEAPVAIINGVHFRIGMGEDGKRALAFRPQSIGAGNLKEAMLRLYDPELPESYIGDAYFGRTPFRAPIHDSLLNEIPIIIRDRVRAAIYREMLRPIKEQPCPEEWGVGPYLTIGVEAKAGGNWAPYVGLDEAREKGIPVNLEGMKGVPVPGLKELGVSMDEVAREAESEEEQEELSDLARVVA